MYIALEISSNLEVFPGQNAIFSCRSSSLLPELTYHWTKLYSNGSEIALHEINSDIVLSNNMLVVNNVSYLSDGTAYYCNAVRHRSSELSYLNGKSVPNISIITPCSLYIASKILNWNKIVTKVKNNFDFGI